ncbi:MAG: TRAM domain-containing protein, partial [Lachnospiraceae bacterium]|nr:TRAM domain-containing protein [Lachnospiraceae bacterium]
MYRKNEIYNVTITDLGIEGEGIGKIDGYPLFVKDALPGDVVEARLTKVKKTYA